MNTNEPIFLKLSRNYDYSPNSQEYTFYSNSDSHLFKAKILYELIDPSIDATFKYLFTDSDIKILEDMLNSLLFPETHELTIIQILNNEIIKPNQKQNKGTIRSDIACKAKYNGGELIIGIEMQIGHYRNFSDRLLKYNVGLCYKYDYQKSWINGLFINTNNDIKYSSYIHQNKYHNGNQQELDFSKIVEIDLKEEINKIYRGEDISINNKKIGNHGKEWLKLLGLRTWCPKRNNRYILPKNYILSNNTYFNQAISILSNIPIPIINNSINLENDIQNYFTELENAEKKGKRKGKKEGKREGKREGIKEGIREGITKEKITSAFKLYAGKCETKFILDILGKKKFNVNDVISILEEFVEKDEEKVTDFILFLNENKFV